MKYYHVTEFQNVPKIMSEGLKANQKGEINIFLSESIVGYAAKNRLLLSDFGLLEIDHEGITGRFIPEKLEQLTSQYQFIVYQKEIEPKYLKFKGVYKI